MDEKTLFYLMALVTFSARSDVCRAARLLGFQQYEIPVLVRVKLLKPLGSPAQNGHKFFCTAELLRLAVDREWLDKATRAIGRYYQQKHRQAKGMKGNEKEFAQLKSI